MSLDRPHGILDFLRLLGTGLFVVVFMAGSVVVLSLLFPKAPTWIIVPISLLSFFGSTWGALAIFHGRLLRRSQEEIQKERTDWEQSGLLIHESFRALRAFQVEEYEDEGSHYFLELEDHSVLFLSGQFLYEYEVSDKRSRRFPCTEFTVRRHKDKGFIVDVVCSGEVLEPEVIAQPFSLTDAENNAFMEEVQVIPAKSYDEVKAERLATTRKRR